MYKSGANPDLYINPWSCLPNLFCFSLEQALRTNGYVNLSGVGENGSSELCQLRKKEMELNGSEETE